MNEARVCDRTLGRKVHRKMNAVLSTTGTQTENWRIVSQKPATDKFCVIPMKDSPVFVAANDENLAGRNIPSLPLDVLVNIFCKLSHHELEPLYRVSRQCRQAVEIAQETHFAYKTPDNKRRRIHSTFVNKSSANSSSTWNSSTPKAPKRVQRRRRICLTDKVMADLRRTLIFSGEENAQR